MQLGSIWGHGTYVAPDWSADWLHREAVALADIWARRESGTDLAALSEEQQARWPAACAPLCAPMLMTPQPAPSRSKPIALPLSRM